MTVICWCGHADRFHRTAMPNNCQKCDACEYFRPKGKPHSTGKAILARFDGTCKACGKPIASQKDRIMRTGSIWIHESCRKS